MASLSQPRQSDADRRAPIKWLSDNRTVSRVIVYCIEEVHKAKKGTRYGDARSDILTRIYGNAQNPFHLAYNGTEPFGQITFDTIAKEHRNHPYGEAGYIAALESEWGILKHYFERNFMTPVRRER